jgi:SUKH-3 immunity protein
VLPWPQLALVQEWPPMYDDRVAEPGRFPDELARIMAGGGWKPLNQPARELLADVKINDMVRAAGHVPFPAIRRMLVDFPLLSPARRGPGVRRAIRVLTLDPMGAAFTTDALAGLASVVGAPLFPMGREGWGDALLAMDSGGRVFGLDQAASGSSARRSTRRWWVC